MSGMISSFMGGKASGSTGLDPTTEVPTQSPGNAYSALFGSSGNNSSKPIQQAPIPTSTPQIAAPQQAAPIMPQQSAPQPQLATSDYQAKTNIRPGNKELDNLLDRVYMNIINKKRII